MVEHAADENVRSPALEQKIGFFDSGFCISLGPMAVLRNGWLIILAVLLTGCGKTNVAGVPPLAAPTNSSNRYLDHAQPRLPTIKLWIGAQEMVTELALTETQIATGMMHRKSIGENEGMLFVFARPHRTSFYMRNTIVPLSAAYIDGEGIIMEIHDFKPLEETPVQASSDHVQYVLETPQGWFKKNNVAVGTVIRSERGTMQETFFRNKR